MRDHQADVSNVQDLGSVLECDCPEFRVWRQQVNPTLAWCLAEHLTAKRLADPVLRSQLHHAVASAPAHRTPVNRGLWQQQQQQVLSPPAARCSANLLIEAAVAVLELRL